MCLVLKEGGIRENDTAASLCDQGVVLFSPQLRREGRDLLIQPLPFKAIYEPADSFPFTRLILSNTSPSE